MKEATIIQGDDWVGVYIDGKLITQGHQINSRELLRELGYFVEFFEPDYDWLDGEGSLPDDLQDVKLMDDEAQG